MLDMTSPSNSTFIPFNPFSSAAAGSVSPQGFDFGQFAQQLAGQAAQALPGLILGLLASHPTVGPLVRAQGVAPQSLSLGINTPFGGGGINLSAATPSVSPQGLDIGQIAQQVAAALVPHLPGLIMGLLSANPTVRPPLQTQGAAPSGVAPQGFDFGQFAQQLAGQAAQALPGLILGLLASHPTVGPLVRAQGVAPQSFSLGINTPFGGGGINISAATPSAPPQGLDVGVIAQHVAPLLPGLIMGVLSTNPVLHQQLRSSTIH